MQEITRVIAGSKQLAELARVIREGCLRCGLCQNECGFLQRHGLPAELAAEVGSPRERNAVAFECSLCGLCAAVCPVGLNPAGMLQAMRSAAARAGELDLRRYAPILEYELRGFSPLYTFYGLPPDCDTVLFPGCAFSGTRSKLVEPLYAALRRDIPGLGVVLDCCCRPSLSLGLDAFFERVFGEMTAYLIGQGVRRVLVACPNCWRTFNEQANEVAVETVYDRLAASPETLDWILGAAASRRGVVRAHDPCALRFAPETQAAVRILLGRAGMDVEEMAHSGARTQCCG
jgi:Fe-S oxidoreductase